MGRLETLASGVLTVGAYSAFAPVTWNEAGTARGKDIEFLRGFARLHGLDVKVRFFEFDRIWERPGRGEIDIAAAGIAPWETRRIPGIIWSRPYHTVQRSLVVRAADEPRLRTMADFAGRTISVTRGSTADLDTRRRKPATARVVFFERQEDAIHDLLAGRIDAFGTGDICSYHVAAQNAELAVTDIHEMKDPEHFAFALSESSALAAPLDGFIQQNAARYPAVSPTCDWTDYQI
ncbi:MAG: transporter substrate-binding domain-containing protein [Verrucomicrobiota bacterium]